MNQPLNPSFVHFVVNFSLSRIPVQLDLFTMSFLKFVIKWWHRVLPELNTET